MRVEDLIEQLNETYCASLGSHQDRKFLSEAATLLRSQQDRIEALELALKPFAGLFLPTKVIGNAGTYALLYDDIRLARSTLTSDPTP